MGFFKKISLSLVLLFLLIVISLTVWSVKNLTFETRKKASESVSAEEKEFSEIRSLDISQPIYRFTASGQLTLKKENSFFRIILIDKDQKEYLVYEAYPLIVDDQKISLDNTCEETCVLKAIIPDKLRIEGLVADFVITQTFYEDAFQNLPAKIQSLGIERAQIELKKEKESLKIQKLNEQIKKKGLKWIAGETSISKLSYEKKKKLFSKPDGTPVDKLPNLQGFEYYKGGIFEIISSDSVSPNLTSETSNFPATWDWRNRHGQNWLTSVKDQGNCGSCWAFAAVGAVEANTNLYFNTPINPDLSEQELLSCSDAGSCVSGSPDAALQYIQNNGIINEECFPYQASQLSCQKCSNELNKIKINSFDFNNHYANENLLKSDLIKKGVLVSGIYSLYHVMALVGWETETDNTTWIFKNSWGTTWGENGYARIKMSLSDHRANSINLPISISNSSQQIACTDNDNDGYCYWGLSIDKPDTCPAFCQPEKDCDDSNLNLGPFDSNFNCINLLTPPAAFLHAHITLQGRPTPPNKWWVTPLEVTVCGKEYSVNTDQSGNFSINDLTAGSCDIRLKGSHTLGNMKKGVVLNPGENNVDFGTLLEGDANDDNYINIADFVILRAGFSPNFDSRADFNQDGYVTITDFSLLRANYAKFGDIEAVSVLGNQTGTGSVQINLKPASFSAVQDDFFSLDLEIAAGEQPLDGIATFLNFDSGKLQVEKIEIGNQFTSVFLNHFDNQTGQIDFAAGSFGNFPTSTFKPATIFFKAVSGTGRNSSPFSFANTLPRQTEATYQGTSVLGNTNDGAVTIKTCLNRELGNLDCDTNNLINETDLTILLNRWGEPNLPSLETFLSHWLP